MHKCWYRMLIVIGVIGSLMVSSGTYDLHGGAVVQAAAFGPTAGIILYRMLGPASGESCTHSVLELHGRRTYT
jgi:hypothetical protein